MNKIMFLVLCIVALPVSAADYSAVVHLASKHSVPGYNESNPGVGLRIADERGFISAGAYRNSISNTSVYAGVGKQLVKIGSFDLTLTAGFVTGYRVPVAPFVIPEIGFDFGKFKVIVNYIPRIESAQVDQAVGLSVGVTF